MQSNRRVTIFCPCMIYHGVVRHCMVWHGKIWYGMVWYGVVNGMLWCSMAWYGLVKRVAGPHYSSNCDDILACGGRGNIIIGL